ncbi:hypothetical protein J7E29_13555 [Streptomyces sp. ISL-90]|nr:hypothetical protein [Streptomyces sp. ISL-90]
MVTVGGTTIGGLALVAIVVLSGVALIWAATRWDRAWIVFVVALWMNGIAISIDAFSVRPEQLAFVPLVLAIAKARRLEPGARWRILAGGRQLAAVFLVVWFVLSVFSDLFVAVSPTASLFVLARMSLSIIALFAVFGVPAPQHELFRLALRPLTVICLISIAGWLLAQFAGVESALVSREFGESVYRLRGFAFEPNIFGAMCVVWLAVALYFRSHFVRSDWLGIASLGICAILSATRTAWIVLAIIVGIAVFSGLKSVIRALWVGAGLVTAALLSAYLFSSAVDLSSLLGYGESKAENLLELGSGTGLFRSQTWELAWRQIELGGNNLFMGFGNNSFTQQNEGLVSESRIDYLSNAWVAHVYDSGWVAAIALILSLYVIWTEAANRLAAIPLFVAVALCSSITNPLWFAFPWVCMALVADRTRRPSVATQEHVTGGRNGATRVRDRLIAARAGEVPL